MKKILYLLITTMLFYTSANAICNAKESGGVLSKLELLCWDCFFPIKISGNTIIAGSMPEGGNIVLKTTCECPGKFGGLPQVGIPIGWFQADRFIDVVSDPLCFPSLGFDLGKGSSFMMNLAGSLSKISSGATFMQTHELYFVPTAILDIFTDFACFKEDTIPLDIGYLTEFDPLWQSSLLSSVLNPEAILFANPVTNLSCIADSTSSQVNMPLDSMFWCKGAWGNSYPLSGWVTKQGVITDSVSIASSLIFKLHRELLAWNHGGISALCFSHPMPFWIKSSNRLQLLHPIPHPLGTGIGQTGLLWDFGKNPPFSGDDFGFVWFRQHDCCAL